MANNLNWFEIPVSDFDRAKKFYELLLDAKIEKMVWGPTIMGFFPAQNQSDLGGAIVSGEGYVPSDKGVLIYLNGGDDLNNMLSRVEKAGGKVLVPKTIISEDYGFFALFTDSEGNKLALHSSK
jgi:hypothetical protein